MTATNQTPNFSLPQWIGTDYVKRTEMNRGFTVIDTELQRLTDAMLAEGTAAPANTKKYWLDTTTTPPRLKKYDAGSSTWIDAIRQHAAHLPITDAAGRFTAETVEDALAELGAAHTAQESSISSLDSRMGAVETKNTEQDTAISGNGTAISALQSDKMNKVSPAATGSYTMKAAAWTGEPLEFFQNAADTSDNLGFIIRTGRNKAGEAVELGVSLSAGTMYFKDKGGVNRTVLHAGNTPATAMEPDGTRSRVMVSSGTAKSLAINGTWAAPPFDSKTFDPKSEYNLSTNTFTPALSGVFMVNFRIRLQQTATSFAMRIKKNGTVVKTVDAKTLTSGTYQSFGDNVILNLAAGDAVTFEYYCTSGAAVSLNPGYSESYVDIVQVI